MHLATKLRSLLHPVQVYSPGLCTHVESIHCYRACKCTEWILFGSSKASYAYNKPVDFVKWQDDTAYTCHRRLCMLLRAHPKLPRGWQERD